MESYFSSSFSGKLFERSNLPPTSKTKVTGTIAPQKFLTEHFDAFLAARREPAWLVAQRREAWAAFHEMPLPDISLEEWRRTDIRSFKLDKFDLPAGQNEIAPYREVEVSPEPFVSPRFLQSSADRTETPRSRNEQGFIDLEKNATPPAALLTEGVDLAGSMTTVDSRHLIAELDPEAAMRGVLFGSLDALVFDYPDLVKKYLFTEAVDFHADKFAALHAACWSGGTLLYVPKGVVIEKPLHILSGLTPGGVDYGHTLIVLEEGAEATVLQETASTDEEAPGFHCGAIEIFVGPRAKLRYVNLQNWGKGVWHFAHQKAIVERDAELQWTIGALGSRLAKVNQHVSLVGAGANAQVNGVMFTEGRQHLSYHTLQRHHVPQCKSDLLYKGALQDHSRLVWRGMIKVDPDAQKTDGYQRDDNLLLSEDARADSIPGLEIEADDVKCSHGATAGRVDDEQVFYARCRGLSRNEAVRMIVAGFFQQVFDRIALESVRHALGEAIGRRIREYN